jgi:tetratricopeptide (TPR) repeat protein
MIESVPDPEVNSPGDQQPLVLIPVTAEDFSRRRARIGWTIAVAAVVILTAAGYIYKRTVDPLHARESFDAGTRLFKSENYSQATLSLDRAIALKPDFVEAYLLRGKASAEQSDLDKAMSDFSKVIELRPSDPQGWLERGSCYFELNNFQAAVADSSQAIALNPKLAKAYAQRGSAYRKLGDLRKALEDFNHAVELDPSAPNYFERGALHQLLGEHELAVADFDRVVEIMPDLPTAYFARAASRRALGDLVGSEKDHLQGRILDGR